MTTSLPPEPRKRFGKGLLLICVGSALLFHTLGLFQHVLTALILIASLGMITYGMILTNAYTALINLCKQIYALFQK